MQVARKSKNKEELWLGLLLVAKKIREKRSIKKLAVIHHLATSVPIVSAAIHARSNHLNLVQMVRRGVPVHRREAVSVNHHYQAKEAKAPIPTSKFSKK